MTKDLCILGSTGSIGRQALDVVDQCGLHVTALTACKNVDIIEGQIRKYRPAYAAMSDEAAAAELKARVAGMGTQVFSGHEGVCECARASGADTVLNAIVGIAGLESTLAAVQAGKNIALANKETLVAGGSLVTRAVREKGVALLPVDSEHSAIFQSLQGSPGKQAVHKLILTASGGPFFGKTRAELENVTAEQALNHPNWSMGPKITVDSASMMNKGLELIEAVWLFDMRPDDVEIVIHRESIVHSLVEYVDHSVIAQLGLPDMRIPIQYALTYPERFESPVGRLSLSQVGKLTFYEPDYETFPLMNVCRSAIKRGGLYPAYANSANEEANILFRQGKIRFMQISELVTDAVDRAPKCADYTLEDVLNADVHARAMVRESVQAE
ncbi:MAG: 1-deoxy-D-xylulose-5-phosphate reductoisomerase [Clostridia bacterium]